MSGEKDVVSSKCEPPLYNTLVLSGPAWVQTTSASPLEAEHWVCSVWWVAELIARQPFCQTIASLSMVR